MAKSGNTNLLNETMHHFPVAGIGASAGGLEAFKELVHAIPASAEIAFMLMQHLDPSYKTALAEILQHETSLPVLDLGLDVKMEPGHIYVIPSDKILVFTNGQLALEPRPAITTTLYPIDLFFSALAESFQSYAVGILLSGMGEDGTTGLKKIKDYGGVTFVQTPASAQYASMPEHAIKAGVVDFKLTAAAIPSQLMIIQHSLKVIPLAGEFTALQAEEEGNFKQILHLLRLRRAVDFTYYKQTTIRRRILRRMLLNNIDDLGKYVKLLEEQPSEQDILYQELLIPVTSYFRDTVIFEKLCKNIFPEIFENKKRTTPVRMWVAGCSTGEEAYSIAICLHEYLGEDISRLKLQVFATDISEKAIQKARTGIYTKKELHGVSEARLHNHFIKLHGQYQVKKNIRDLCVFATHNFLKDPPFAKMDFISCRNVLIYMEGYLQRKALETFHYALNEKGILLLGKSETAGNGTELFKTIDKTEKIYSRKALAGRTIRLVPEHAEKISRFAGLEKTYSHTRKEDFHKNADDVLLSKYTPAGVVVNEHLEIVQFRGSTGMFLEAAPGKASLHILKMAREGLSFEIRNSLHKAREAKDTVIKTGIPVNNGKTLVTVEVIPLLQTTEPHYLILFREDPPLLYAPEVVNGQGTVNDLNSELENKRILQLEKDLSQLREDMRSITEDQEAANEELQSANEELLSGSEELQSLNEELETSKEELQSTNEELLTVNQELYERNEQYNQARLYSEAIIATIHEPLLVLNRDLRVKSANIAFLQIFDLKEEEISGKILFELQESKWDIPELRTRLLKIQTGHWKEMELELEFLVSETNKRTMLLKANPVSPENSEQLILLAFEDITLIKNEVRRHEASADKLKKELHIIELFFQQAPALFCVLKGPEHNFEFINPRYNEVSGGKALKGKRFIDAFPEYENEGYIKILDDVYSTGLPFLGREMKANHFPGSKTNNLIYVDLSCQPYRDDQGAIAGVLFFSYEVTEQVLNRRLVEKNAEELEGRISERTFLLQAANIALEKSNKNLQEFASIASHDLQEPLRKIKTFTSILKDKYGGELTENAKQLVEKTQDSANRMSALIRDVLNYSRIVVPEKSYVPTNLNDILKKIMIDFDLVAEEKQAVLNIQSGIPLVEALPLQMNQLFYNLVGNALKFSSKTRLPIISISWKILDSSVYTASQGLRKDEIYYEVEVKDNGIGFEQQFAEQIFSLFERLNTNIEYEGTGIGLALCRKIMDNHQGFIRAESAEEQGSSFFITLPAKQ